MDKNQKLPITGEMNEALSGSLLAYLGDAQLELIVRKKLILRGGRLGELNKAADSLVSAEGQCKALEKLMPLFTDEEAAAFRRGNNIHTNSIPKHCTPLQYRKATGLEAVFGYLALKNDAERIEFFVDVGFFE